MRTLIAFLFLLLNIPLWACEACERQQPAMLKGITHGTGPQGGLDMPIVYGAAVIVLFTLVMSIKYLVKPNEDSEEHIKRVVLHNSLSDNGR